MSREIVDTSLIWKRHQKIPVLRIMIWSVGDWRCKDSDWAAHSTAAPIPINIEAMYMKAFKEFYFWILRIIDHDGI